MTARRIPATTKHPPHDDEVDDLSIEYPDSDGEPMAENESQLFAMIDAISTLKEWFSSHPGIYVGGDMLIYYRMNDNETRVAPDVFVVTGATDRPPRRSWLVWREGKAPDFVMEMASGSTWQRDLTEKRDIYAGMGVTEYWRFDPTGEHFIPPLVGERLADGEYQRISLETDADSVLWSHSPILGLDICVLPDFELRLFDPASGQWLRTLHESEAALREEAAARQAAEAGRQTAEAARQTAEARQQEEAAARQATEDENRRLRERLRLLESGQ